MASSFSLPCSDGLHSRPREAGMLPEQREMRAERVRDVIHERNRRTEFFRADMFSDPAWDVLLEVYSSHLSQHRISMSQIGMTSNVPITTANRWIKILECEGLLAKTIDPLDSRRVYVELTFKGVRAVSGYFRSGSG
jgi:DNA-binding MarR family transcriptional regulator